MATLFGDQYAAAYNTKPSTKFGVGQFNANVKRLYFEYTITAAPTAADIIEVCRIPKGARIYDAALKFPDLGTTGVLELGWLADADAVESTVAQGLLSTVDVNTSVDLVQMTEQQRAAGALTGYLKRFDAEVDVIITVTTAWTVTSGVIKGYVEYVDC